ncbi:probable glutamate receptor [Penaeus indicus]|uniref:probable glutamate receptor n=1 Tax=Penaeus indicus TaxID=29960 RepID=UPI00300C4190
MAIHLTLALCLTLALHCNALQHVSLAPSGEEKVLPVLSEVVHAVLDAQCSIFVVTNGNATSATISKFLRQNTSPWGVGVFEVPGSDYSPKTMAGKELHQVIQTARKVRESSSCVSVVVLSDDLAFLASFAESSLRGRLLVWATRLLVVTRLPLQELRRLYQTLSLTNSALLVLSQDLVRASIYVQLPYRPPSGQLQKVASWSSQGGLVLQEKVFPDKFSRFPEGASLTVAAEQYFPHVEVVESPGSSFSFRGPMAKLLDILAKSMNFTYSFKRPPDGAWGGKLPDGSYNGMVGMVSRKEVDLGLGPFGMSTVRAAVVDFTKPILIDYARILGGRGRAEIDPWGFLLPLTPEVWAGLAALGLLVLLSVASLSYLSRQYLPGRGSRNLYFGVTCMIHHRNRCLLSDTKVLPERRWERVLLAGWMIVTLVTVKSYAGNLMSLLAVRHIPQPYQSVRDVLDDASCTMIWEANTAYVQFVESVSSGTFHEVSKAGKAGRILYKKTTEYLDAIDSVRSRPYVLILEDLTHKLLMGQDFSNTGRCDFYTSRELFLPFIFAMIGQKNHPLVPALSERITAVTEAGLYSHWVEASIPNATSCARTPSKITVTSSLSFANLWGMFVLLLSGQVVGLVVLALEISIHRLSR